MISWIKLDINILDDAKIKIIRSHPDGDSVFVLWIGLLCLAMKSTRPGIIEIAEGLPYTIDDLSNLFQLEKKTVEMGLALFVKYQMVELFEGGEIEVINFAKHQKIEEIQRRQKLTRERVKIYREKQRICNASVTRYSITCNADVTPTDIDKDIDIDKDKREYREKKPPNPKKIHTHTHSYKTSLPENFGISDRVRHWAEKKGFTELEQRLEDFRLKCQAKDYRYADWDAAFMAAIRSDWAKLNQGGNNEQFKSNQQDTGYLSVQARADAEITAIIAEYERKKAAKKAAADHAGENAKTDYS